MQRISRGARMMRKIAFVFLLAFSGTVALVAADADVLRAQGKPLRPLAVQYLADEYGRPPAEINALLQNDNDLEKVRAYLESFCQPASPRKLVTKDFVALASQCGIKPMQAVRVYQLAQRHHRDPLWIARLYKENPDWQKLEAAFARYAEAKTQLVAVEAAGKGSAAAYGQVLASVYHLPAGVITQYLTAGMGADVFLELLFWADTHFPEELSSRTISFTALPLDWQKRLPDFTPQRTRWPQGRFPASLPLPPRDGKTEKPSGQPGTPEEIPAEGSPSVVPEAMTTATTMTTMDSGSPSLVDPGALYNTDRVSPFKAYFDGFAYQVEPASGELVLSQTDFTLPGRNGLDFALTRIYRNQQAHLSKPKVEWYGYDPYGMPSYLAYEDPNTYLDQRYGLGVGWALAFPTLEIPPDTYNTFYLHWLDGRVFDASEGYLHHYELQDLKFQFDTSYAGASYSLRRKDGLVWYFSSDGKLLAIVNRFGDKITFTYTNDSIARISKVIDSVGRAIKFTYANTQVTVSVYEADTATATLLFTWTYQLAPTSYSGKYQLIKVVSPEPGTPPIEYTYSEDVALSKLYDAYGSYIGEVNFKYLNLATVKHPSASVFRFKYALAEKDVEDNDPSEDKPSRLDYYRVNKCWQEVPTVLASSEGQSTIITTSGIMDFQYGNWDSSTQRYSTTRLSVRATGETGVAPASERWEFDKEHQLCRHEITGSQSGVARDQQETVRTDYTQFMEQLPSKELKTVTVGSSSRQEETTYEWDLYGNLLSVKDPLGRKTEYTYDTTYSLPTYQFTQTRDLPREGRRVERVLDSAKKVVVEKRQALVRKVTDGMTTVYTAPGTPISTLYNWQWTPPDDVTRFDLEITWHTNIFWCTITYTVSYCPAESDEPWTQVAQNTHGGGMWADGGTDYVAVLLPTLGLYKIKIDWWGSGQVGLLSGRATGPYYYWQNLGPAVKETYSYDPNRPGNLTTYKIYNADGTTLASTTNYTYDSRWGAYPAQLSTRVTKADGSSSTLTISADYDTWGRIIRYRTQDENATTESSYAYDKLNRLVALTLPPQHVGETAPTVTRQYLDSQRQIVITDARAHQRRETYDGLGRFVLGEWKDANNNWQVAAHVRYNSLGQVVSLYDGSFRETRSEYDAFGRKIKTFVPGEDPSRPTAESWYVAAGPLPPLSPALDLTPPAEAGRFPWVRWEKHVDGDGHPTYQGYDGAGRLVWSATNPGSGSGKPDWELVWCEYDVLDRLTRLYVKRTPTTGEWDVTAYSYESIFSQPTAMDLPGDTEPIHAYTYDSRGLKIAEDEGTADEIRYEYDELGRPRKVTYPGNSVTKFFYDKDGHVTRAELWESGALVNVVKAEYNLRGWLEKETWEFDGRSFSLSYGYDQAGNRTSITYPDGSPGTTVSFVYDERDQLARKPGFFENPAWPNQAGFQYDANGFCTTKRAANNITTTYTPDVRGRLQTIESGPLNLTYVYTPNGNVASITDINVSTALPFISSYNYDGANRLTAMTFQWPGGDNETLQYRYDGAGNRLQEVWDNGVTIDYRYLPGNYLAEMDGVVQSERDNATVEYVYNTRQQLAQVKHNDTVIAQFFYDALGRRIKAVEGNTTTITLYVGNDVVYEEKATSSTPTRKTSYLVVNGQYLAKTVRDGSNPPEKYFYHTDLVGSIRAITDMAGQVVASLTYEPFGRELASSNSADAHRFTGKPLDATELYYFGARYYDPDLGRFITQDPAQDGVNWYEYCFGNPLKYIDPSGLRTIINSSGEVTEVVDDGSLSIWMAGDDFYTYIGETYFWDTFQVGNKIHVGVDKTDDVMKLAEQAFGESPVAVAFQSRDGQRYDISSTWRGKGYLPTDGFLFLGRYCTVRDMGNALAGLNARNIGISFDTFQRMAGAVHQNKGLKGIIMAFLGKEYGPAPYYGEVEVQYRMSKIGYNAGYKWFRNHLILLPTLRYKYISEM